MVIDNLDLVALSSKSSDVDNLFRAWMSEYFNKPNFSENMFAVEWYDSKSCSAKCYVSGNSAAI